MKIEINGKIIELSVEEMNLLGADFVRNLITRQFEGKAYTREVREVSSQTDGDNIHVTKKEYITTSTQSDELITEKIVQRNYSKTNKKYDEDENSDESGDDLSESESDASDESDTDSVIDDDSDEERGLNLQCIEKVFNNVKKGVKTEYEITEIKNPFKKSK